MLRYNHGTIERKWMKRWSQKPILAHEVTKACTLFIPESGDELGLENLRLLILTDFFGLIKEKTACQLSVLNSQESWHKNLNVLDYFSWDPQQMNKYDLAVIPRDYAYLVSEEMIQTEQVLYCGRFLQTKPLNELLPDFGLDSLRLYFLNMGPIERDYIFSWNGLVSAYRFINKVWQFGQVCTNFALDALEQNALESLHEMVHSRLMRQKPHTALAAIMGYIKNKATLTKDEVCLIARLLQPFTPFLSAELLELMTLVKD